MTKLFKLVQKSTPGQCDAMRCKEESIGETDYIDGRKAQLCELHMRDLQRYAGSTEPVESATLTTTVVPTDSLENILVSNLAVKSGAVESREETAKEIHGIALAIKVINIDSRDKADQLLSLVHEEEKKLKAEVNAMYKPIKDAAKATKNRLDSWFGPTLDFYTEAKSALKEKLGSFLRAEKAKEDVALATGDHEAAALCATEASENVRLKRSYNYAILNDGKNLPLELLAPDDTKNAEIVKLLPREMLIPNYDLISALVKEHGDMLDIPDVRIILVEDIQMKGKRK